MKAINKQDVQRAAELSLAANGRTTTLEVKLALRMLGFQAFQSEVSGFMDELFNEEKFDREMNASGKHWDYIPTVADNTIDVDIDDGDGSVGQLTSGAQPALGSGTVAISAPASTRAVPFVDDLTPMSKADMATRFHEDDWVAFDEVSGTKLAFPKTYTRDKCRAAFQRQTGIPYNNVRCQTISWYTR